MGIPIDIEQRLARRYLGLVDAATAAGASQVVVPIRIAQSVAGRLRALLREGHLDG